MHNYLLASVALKMAEDKSQLLTDAILLLPSPAWAEGTVLSWFVCVCVYVCLSVTTKLLFKCTLETYGRAL